MLFEKIVFKITYYIRLRCTVRNKLFLTFSMLFLKFVIHQLNKRNLTLECPLINVVKKCIHKVRFSEAMTQQLAGAIEFLMKLCWHPPSTLWSSRARLASDLGYQKFNQKH